MSTMQEVLDLGRRDLNDDAKIRYFDVDGIKYLNDGIARAYVIRPDLKFGSYGTAFSDLTTASAFPLPIEYRKALADYVTYRFFTSDDEFVSSGLVKEANDSFLKEMLG